MHKYLVFQLYGPMVSWGDVAVGEYRPSFAHPSKSAIVGLLAAALGIRRDEEERQKSLSESCSFAVRVDSMGVLLRDYHTIQVPSTKRGVVHYTRRSELATDDLNTILSTRDYYCDATYTVAVAASANSPYPLQMLKEALSKPFFHLYLGRKSCPLAMPLQAQIVSANNASDAFAVLPFSEELFGVTPESVTNFFWDENMESGVECQQIMFRRDEINSRKRWQFSERRESRGIIRREG